MGCFCIIDILGNKEKIPEIKEGDLLCFHNNYAYFFGLLQTTIFNSNRQQSFGFILKTN